MQIVATNYGVSRGIAKGNGGLGVKGVVALDELTAEVSWIAAAIDHAPHTPEPLLWRVWTGQHGRRRRYRPSLTANSRVGLDRFLPLPSKAMFRWSLSGFSFWRKEPHARCLFVGETCPADIGNPFGSMAGLRRSTCGPTRSRNVMQGFGVAKTPRQIVALKADETSEPRSPKSTKIATEAMTLGTMRLL